MTIFMDALFLPVLLTKRLVYMARPATVSPDRILAAAAAEFAERGYAGARVDRIARKARVNKAMLYYHFGSKQALYRALLRHTFAQVAARLQTIAASGHSAPDQIEAVVETLAGFVSEHRHFPAIMLREIADGATHLDRDTFRALAALPATVGGIVQQGVTRRELRSVHPLVAYLSVMAPVVMFLAGAPIRKEMAVERVAGAADLTPELFISQLKDVMRRAFALAPNEKSR
jgi:TetR/AcrR family transcriptional regulator